MPNTTHLENYQIVGDRRCGICKQIKPVSAFPRRKSGRYAGALLHCCNDCNLDRVHAWNKAHPGATAKRNHAKGICAPYSESHECHTWIGIHITERLALCYFTKSYQMPFGNPGYDIVNKEGIKIDCKASHLRKTSRTGNGWQFAIDKNNEADSFFCVAFGSESDGKPLHAWMIPSSEISHLKRLTIGSGNRSIAKWIAYELPIEYIIICWNKVK